MRKRIPTCSNSTLDGGWIHLILTQFPQLALDTIILEYLQYLLFPIWRLEICLIYRFVQKIFEMLLIFHPNWKALQLALMHLLRRSHGCIIVVGGQHNNRYFYHTVKDSIYCLEYNYCICQNLVRTFVSRQQTSNYCRLGVCMSSWSPIFKSMSLISNQFLWV